MAWWATFATGTVDVAAWWWAPLTWTVTCVLVLAAAAVQIWPGSKDATAPTADRLAEAEEKLVDAVRSRWNREVAARGLEQPVPMPVRWRLHELSTASDAPGVGFPGSGDQVAEFAGRFRALQRQRLVILGGPGSGKTTLAVQLLLALLPRSRGDGPVPVLLSVTGWNSGAVESFQEWLVDKIARDYPDWAREHGRDTVRLLVERDRIMPMLDGLDELPAAGDLISMLNESLTAESRFILTCRTEQFRDAVASRDRPARTAVIEPDPFTPQVIARYLRECLRHSSRAGEHGQAWPDLLAALEAPSPPDGPVATLAGTVSTPLGLWLLRTTYISSGGDPRELLDAERYPDRAALHQHLLDQLIPSLAGKKRPPAPTPGRWPRASTARRKRFEEG